MPNQKDIARALGISQGAVSLALRGESSVSTELRRKVRAMAKKLGYRPNPYVSSLMAQIRVSRKPSEQGAIALIVDRYKEDEWLRHESYSVYHHGLVHRAHELGFQIETFFLQTPGLLPSASITSCIPAAFVVSSSLRRISAIAASA